MKIVFLGTPDFALPSLSALVKSSHDILAVVTNPDKRGNKMKLIAPPVKQFAESVGLKVLQYEKISRDGVEELKNLQPELMITAAFGQILSKEVLAIPKYGVINVHGSLLPKYRGASPIQQAILSGDKKTGITIMRTEYVVDSGDIILAKSIDIGEKETAGELYDRLAALGAEALLEAIDLIEKGKAKYTPQNHSEATFTKMLTKNSGLIDFDKTSYELHNFVRGLNPWPTAYTYLAGKLFKIWSIEKFSDNTDYPNGTVTYANSKEGIIVQVSDGTIKLLEVQLEGGKRMSAKDFLVGHTIPAGTVLK